MTSPDGINWTSRTTPSSNVFLSVSWSPELSMFCGNSSDGTNRIIYSYDGSNWYETTSSEQNSWTNVCWSPELSIFCHISADGTNRVMTSDVGLPTSFNTPLSLPGQLTVNTTNGFVGIGTSEPLYPLHVDTETASTESFVDYISTGAVSSPTTRNWNAYFDKNVLVGVGVFISSDKRIKTNIAEINDTSALDTLRLLKPSTYNYIDTYNRTNNRVFGYIAQEVAEVIPEAVDNTTTEIIPSFYSNYNCSAISST